MINPILLSIILLFMFGCSTSKTVLICGDHVCVNKNEAEQYFEDNLSLEVRIIDKKEKNKIDLVELNLKAKNQDFKSVSITEKNNTKKDIKVLTNDEIKKKKAELKNREKINKLKDKDNRMAKVKVKNKEKTIKKKKDKLIKVRKINNKDQKQIVDICVVLEKCNIDEISKYLIEQGQKKGFPDITLRE